MILDTIMLCYKFFGQDNSASYLSYTTKKDRSVLCWRPLPEDWIKINVDTFGRHRSRSTTIGYIMRGNRPNFIMARNSRLGDCPILVADCETVCEAILMAA